ncbi:MAG: DNA-processing protein DprA [Acidimicrobiales bacterium]|nr:DNA-processing protein DprA [Acidimicrobiales bacterium]
MRASSREPEEAAVALASLPAMGPGRLTALVRTFGFARAWDAVCRGRPSDEPDVARALGAKAREIQDEWARASRTLDPSALFDQHHRAGIEVTTIGADRFPSVLAADLEPPMVLFSVGDLEAISGRRVAIVGTRRCTRSGRLTAREMGRQLAEAGVAVVSGLALGIDGAAHEGTLEASDGAAPIGVVGTGLDTVYPRRHQRLWDAVSARGVLVSEVPMGAGALPWRFPARNRIIAALSEVVVVVESHATGGALHTVDEALRRDRQALVVPGSVRSPASAGTNALLHEGLGPARDVTDVLIALGFSAVTANDAAGHDSAPRRSDLGRADADLLDLVGDTPVSVDQLAARSGLALGDLAVRLMNLEHRGWLVRSGGWVERVRT